MKTTRKIINDCFFKGRPLDYKQHKVIIQELDARDRGVSELLDFLREIESDLMVKDAIAKVKLAIEIAEATHA